jgi:acetolactate synthase-1/2/3 large subunit
MEQGQTEDTSSEQQAASCAPARVTKTLSGAQILIECLLEQGVDTIFGYPGGAIMPVYDALYDYQDKVRHILVRHEQGASHAAEGYARIAGRAGVCIATSGPGATNLVTGIADAMSDSIPMVCITGQVGKWFLGTDAFQETDVIGITMPITKWNYQVTDADEIPLAIAKAFAIAESGRPGPVLIDITKNAQIEKISYTLGNCKELRPKEKNVRVIEPQLLAQAAELINTAKKPYLLIGHGVLISKAQDLVKNFIEKSGVPVATTLLGLSALATDHPLYVGYLGMHGNYGPNILTNEADVIIAIGMRFDDRVTGNLAKYAPNAKVIHIDVDAAEINKNVRTAVGIVADAKQALNSLLPLIKENKHSEWVSKFRECDQTENDKVIQGDIYPQTKSLKMSEVVNLLSEKTKGEAIIIADVGQHQMAAARYYKFKKPDSFVTSGGLGTMGFALPAAMGTVVAAPNRPSIVIVGDGGFQMTLQELATIAQEKMPVKIMILNNQFLGMVRQWQELFFEKRYSFVDMQNPDFVKLTHAFGIDAEIVEERSDLAAAIDRMLASKTSYLLDIRVEKEQNVFPMVPAGASVSEIRLD